MDHGSTGGSTRDQKWNSGWPRCRSLSGCEMKVWEELPTIGRCWNGACGVSVSRRGGDGDDGAVDVYTTVLCYCTAGVKYDTAETRPREWGKEKRSQERKAPERKPSS